MAALLWLDWAVPGTPCYDVIVIINLFMLMLSIVMCKLVIPCNQFLIKMQWDKWVRITPLCLLTSTEGHVSHLHSQPGEAQSDWRQHVDSLSSLDCNYLQTFSNLSKSHCNYLLKGCNTVINSKCATPASSGHPFCFADVRRTASWFYSCGGAVSSRWIMRQLHRADCGQRLRWGAIVFPEYFIYLIKHWYLMSLYWYCVLCCSPSFTSSSSFSAFRFISGGSGR